MLVGRQIHENQVIDLARNPGDGDADIRLDAGIGRLQDFFSFDGKPIACLAGQIVLGEHPLAVALGSVTALHGADDDIALPVHAQLGQRMDPVGIQAFVPLLHGLELLEALEITLELVRDSQLFRFQAADLFLISRDTPGKRQ